MKALFWEGVGKLAVQDVADAVIRNHGDVIIRVRAGSVCGCDLHLINGYLPAIREGNILGHEFMDEVVEVGPAVLKFRTGDRVVVGSVLACGGWWDCRTERFSLCDNSNPQPNLTEKLWGHAPAGIFGYSHAAGGFVGSHPEYARGPFANVGAFTIPDGVSDCAAVSASDAMPTGLRAADFCGLTGGEAVAICGACGVGQLAARCAQLLGAQRVTLIDRIPDRLGVAGNRLGLETIDYSQILVLEAPPEMTGGRGPDARLQTDRPTATRQASLACHKGGTVIIVGVFSGYVDKFPLGAAMNKALVLRMGQMHAHSYISMLLGRLATGEMDPGYLGTHPMPLRHGSRGCVAVAALAAAGVAAIVRYRQGQTPHPDERAHLDELEARLHDVEEPDENVPPTHVGRVIQDLQRDHGISMARLRQWIVRLRHGTLSPEQANIAESDFDALEREADQRGA